MMIGAIHQRQAALIASRTYTDVFEPNGILNVLGGTGGNVILNPVYEFSYKMARVSPETLNVYARTGEDGDQQNHGDIVVRTFDVPSRAMLPDRVVVYTDPAYCVVEYLLWRRESDIWIYTMERLRSSPDDAALGRMCLIKSTDGLRGRSFAPAIVQVNASGFQFNPSNVIDGSADGSVKYLMAGSGSPTRIRRFTIAEDGTLGPPVGLTAFNYVSESSFLNVGNDGVVLSVNRDNNGNYLMQSVSNDWGATFGPIVSTGIGASTGLKITPKITKCANRGDRLTVTFNDRGSSNRDYCSNMTRIADAMSGVWQPATAIGTLSNQGNCSHIVLDVQREEYLYVTARQTGTPRVTELVWWTFKNRYNARRQEVAPWK